MMKNRCLLSAVSLTVTLLAINANALELSEKPLTATVAVTSLQSKTMRAAAATKKVVLMNIQLTNKEKQTFFNSQHSLSSSAKVSQTSTPTNASVNMKSMPVLDQGKHGSCVTFANTGAIDALLKKGDYVSQLCHLNLGRYLKLNGYYPSGWNGSFGPWVLDQITRFGIMNTQDQKIYSCGGIKEYPIYDEEEIGIPVTLDEFKVRSKAVKTEKRVFLWQSILTIMDRIFDDEDNPYDADKVVLKIKQTLASSNPYEPTALITMGVFLPFSHCNMGACATYHAKNDTWALTSAIANDSNLGGHEMIITGYDDKATAIDNEGHVHTGLFTLRNSWGEEVGDHGDFYMTYDFFKRYVMEAQKLMMVHNKFLG